MRLCYINSKMTYMTVEEQKQAILGYIKKTNRKTDNILIFALKTRGLTNFQIAEQLGCATTTLYSFYKRFREQNNA